MSQMHGLEILAEVQLVITVSLSPSSPAGTQSQTDSYYKLYALWSCVQDELVFGFGTSCLILNQFILST